MASYVNITLDTYGPLQPTVKLNGDARRTTTTSVVLTTLLNTRENDDPSILEMKVWGDVVGVPTESDAQWETYTKEKNIVLTSGDGLKEVYVKLRDDVYNESDENVDDITLYTEVPTVTIIGPSVAKISENEGKNVTTFSFVSNKRTKEFKVMVVKNINATHDDATNVLIPAGGGSKVAVNTNGGEMLRLSSDSGLYGKALLVSDGYSEGVEFYVTIYGADLAAASPGDGIKIIKVFAKEADGLWSV